MLPQWSTRPWTRIFRLSSALEKITHSGCKLLTVSSYNQSRVKQVAKVTVVIARIAAQQGSFRRIRQVSPPNCTCLTHGSLGPYTSLSPTNGISIGSAIVFAGLTVVFNIQTHTDTQTTIRTIHCSNNPYLFTECMRCWIIYTLYINDTMWVVRWQIHKSLRRNTNCDVTVYDETHCDVARCYVNV